MEAIHRRWTRMGAMVALALLCLGGVALAQQFSNAATRLNLDRCGEVDRPEEAGAAWRCNGFKNRPEHDVYVFEEDGRYYISYGRDPFSLKAADQTLAPFNTLAEDLEWRLERRAGDWHPFAIIARYFTEVDNEGEFYRGEVLVVIRVGEGEACHAAYIDAIANPNAARLAREAADRVARRFDCDSDEPVVYGERGLSLGPTS